MPDEKYYLDQLQLGGVEAFNQARRNYQNERIQFSGEFTDEDTLEQVYQDCKNHYNTHFFKDYKDLIGADFYKKDLANINLSNTWLRYSILIHANLSGADLTQAFLRDSRFEEADFTGARLEDVAIYGTLVEFADFQIAKFWRADLSEAEFRKCRMSMAQFDNANMNKTIFKDCDFSGSSFPYADLTDAEFINCNLQNTDLSHANLKGTTFRGVDLCGVKNIDKVRADRPVFIDTLGLTDAEKSLLKVRNAVFKDY